MTEPVEMLIDCGNQRCRVWRAGAGEPLVFLPGVGGLPKWPAFLDALAETHEVFAISPPGFPGGGVADDYIHIFEWALAVDEIIGGLGIVRPTLVGASVGGALAAELAAIWPEKFARVVLIAPYGGFDEAEPSVDAWAQRPGREGELLCLTPGRYNELIDAPADADPVEWKVLQIRADSTAARFLWPLGDTGVLGRLRRWRGPTLLLRGSQDRVLPPSYLGHFAASLGGARCDEIEDAGHLAYLDQPRACADAIARFQ